MPRLTREGSSVTGPSRAGRGWRHVYDRSTFDLAADFAQADATGARRDFVQQLTRVDLLVLEDFGMKKLGSNAAEDRQRASPTDD